MVKKLLLLLLISLPLLAIGVPGGKRKTGELKIALKSKRLKKYEDELRRIVGDAGSPLEAYVRLMHSNKSPGMPGSDVLGAGLSVIIGALLVALIQ